MPDNSPALRATIAALPFVLALTASDLRAQYLTDFDTLEVIPGQFSFAPDLWDASAAPMTSGQDVYYAPNATSVPFQAQLYTGGSVLVGVNEYGIPDNPNGGTHFIVGNGPAGGVFARAQRDIPYTATTCSADRWVWGTDICCSFAGTLPTLQNAGSFSVQPFPGSQSFIMLARWTDVATATNWNADMIYFDAAGTQQTVTLSDPAFQNLNVNQWYRWETVANLVTNEIEEVRLIDLTTGSAATVQLTGAYMDGGSAGSLRPTGFRFFAGGGVAGNVVAFDNTSVGLAGGITALPGCGATVPLTVSANPPGPILGSTLDMDFNGPPGLVGSIPVAFLSLTGDPNLPCGTPVPGLLTGNVLIGLPLGTSLASLVPWAGPSPAPELSFPIPNNAALGGTCVFVQGAFVDLAGGAITLTTAAQVELGG